ncbi:hypothetical protein JZO73_08015 [Enterococcus plantarum]|uniref:hypothetical protein n=1 Tax=Enterococcus plantarum TaxID=1077675 RepID=UPI001A8C1B25|nr:hypothetical protein [Enterococcus plantarum]MBO0467481.1 hypothetical protein [Enterococcus plantarum]
MKNNELEKKVLVDIVSTLDKKYEYDLDKKLVATIKALNKVSSKGNLTNDDIEIVNLFLSEQRVLIYEFLENEYYDEEELFIKLGRYAVMELPYSSKEFQKEMITLIELNQEEFKNIDSKDYNKLLREIKKVDKVYDNKINNEENSTTFALKVTQQYIDFLNGKYLKGSSLNIIDRYFYLRGWKLLNGLSKSLDDELKKQREDRQKNYFELWKYRNMYKSKNRIEVYIYHKFLLQDFKNLERYYRELSMLENVSRLIADRIINYYTYTFLVMYIANINESKLVVENIWNKQFLFDNENETYILEGVKCAEELVQQNKKIPSPRLLIKKLGITKSKAEQYNLEILYLDSLSSGTRNRLLLKNKPKPLKKVKGEAKINRINEGKHYFDYLQEKNTTIQKMSEKLGENRIKVSIKIDEYILSEYKVQSKNKNFDEDNFTKRFGITRNKLKRLKSK